MIQSIAMCQHTLDLISERNDGVKPQIENDRSYFIWSDDPNIPNEIMDMSVLRATYRQIRFPGYAEYWNEVIKL